MVGAEAAPFATRIRSGRDRTPCRRCRTDSRTTRRSGCRRCSRARRDIAPLIAELDDANPEARDEAADKLTPPLRPFVRRHRPTAQAACPGHVQSTARRPPSGAARTQRHGRRRLDTHGASASRRSRPAPARRDRVRPLERQRAGQHRTRTPRQAHGRLIRRAARAPAPSAPPPAPPRRPSDVRGSCRRHLPGVRPSRSSARRPSSVRRCLCRRPAIQ